VTTTAVQTRRIRLLALALGIELSIVASFIAARLMVDIPHLNAGTMAEPDSFEYQYVRHPWPAYLHIGLGAVYLAGALLQLSARVRRGHLALHRRLGRVLLTCGLLSGLIAIYYGLRYPFGGRVESVAAIVFGTWFVACLALAFRAIRARRVADHRRWMIRAFAVGVGIAMIRIWVGLFIAIATMRSGDMAEMSPSPTTFGWAFWLGFSLHVAAGEWWLRTTRR
jgi:hypothetical protein